MKSNSESGRCLFICPAVGKTKWDTEKEVLPHYKIGCSEGQGEEKPKTVYIEEFLGIKF